MHTLLSRIQSPVDLRALSQDQLKLLADEMRDVLCEIVRTRPAHFASNLGVVELTLALHSVFDFRRDRLIWDTGHQIYPHKLITGRYQTIDSIRHRGGLMGYPNPAESDYDLFMTGHAGSSVSTMFGLRVGDDLQGESDRHAVAVIGDGAFPSGIVSEALNNAGDYKRPFLVILNDNEMSICPRVGGMAKYLDRLRVNPWYGGLKNEVHKLLDRVPLGNRAEKLLTQFKDSVKAGISGGMLFEDLGFRYIGPIDGHDIGELQQYLKMVKDLKQPVLLHVITQKGHGFEPAAEDPVTFHTPAPFERQKHCVVSMKKSSSRAYTNTAADAIHSAMQRNPKVAVITAAMCQGNKLEKVRASFPERFFDVGICESHAVAFAAGMAKTGMRPIVDIYSTFLQRSFDQIFQEVALQDLPVTFMLDRAGLTGPDGPTHHGVYDHGYMRLFPNMVVMAPGDEQDLPAMLDFALQAPHSCSIRYPKTNVETIERPAVPIEMGKCEVLDWGADGMIVAAGAVLPDCQRAAEILREEGLDVGVINARFLKPLDEDVLKRAIERCGFVITVEEATVVGGFGSAVVEMAVDAGLDTRNVKRLGLPDRFVEHGERDDLLADLGLDAVGIAAAGREMTRRREARERAKQQSLG